MASGYLKTGWRRYRKDVIREWPMLNEYSAIHAVEIYTPTQLTRAVERTLASTPSGQGGGLKCLLEISKTKRVRNGHARFGGCGGYRDLHYANFIGLGQYIQSETSRGVDVCKRLGMTKFETRLITTISKGIS